jgi:hypothetical protein
MRSANFTIMAYRPLPDLGMRMLTEASAPPRLIAHLILVHDVACDFVAQLKLRFPNLQFDSDSVLFGAATHDIGKAVHREELSGQGSLHEIRGQQILLECGIDERLARFAATHGRWKSEPDFPLEDLLVALADNCWRGKRVSELEALVVERLATQSHEPEWKCFSILDEVLQDLASDADARLAWQASFPV